jgi:L-lactate permease
MKTQISLGVITKFAWVWLPQTWTKNRSENSITLTFDVNRRIKHDRIEAAVEPWPGRWTYHVIIKKESDIDENVKAWLQEAYASAQNRNSSIKKSDSEVDFLLF